MGVLSLILLFLLGCSKSEIDQSMIVCKNLGAGQDNILVYYPPFEDKAEIIANESNADTYMLAEGKLASYSYGDKKITCKALIELCFDKGYYKECQDKTIYFGTTQEDWNNWISGKQIFNSR